MPVNPSATVAAPPAELPLAPSGAVVQDLGTQAQVQQIQASALEGAPQPATGLVPGVNADPNLNAAAAAPVQNLDAQAQVQQVQAGAIEGSTPSPTGVVPGVNADAAAGPVDAPAATAAPAGFNQLFGPEAGATAAAAPVPQQDLHATGVAPATTPTVAWAPSPVRSSLPVDALTSIGASQGGEVFRLDKGSVGGMEVRARQIVHPTEGKGTELSFRFTVGESRELAQALEAGHIAGAQKQDYLVEPGTFENGATRLVAENGYVPKFQAPETYQLTNLQAWRLQQAGKFCFEFIPGFGHPQAYRDRVRLRIYGATDAERKANLELAATALKIDGCFADADPMQTERLMRLSLLRMVAPAKAESLGQRLGEVTLEEIEAELQATGVDKGQLAGMGVAEVFAGHLAVVVPSLGESYAKHGVYGIMAGVGSVERAVSILKSDGLMSSTERYGRGIHAAGSSMSADEATGGAEFAFTRLVTTAAFRQDSYNTPWINGGFAAGTVQLVSTGENMRRQLSRTDWHAYPSDCFGITVTDSQADGPPPDPFAANQRAQRGCFSKRLVGKALVEAIDGAGSFKSSNEACFKTGVPASAFDLVVTQSETYRSQLIAALQQAGITTLGGRPLEERVVLTNFWHQLKAQLGYIDPPPPQPAPAEPAQSQPAAEPQPAAAPQAPAEAATPAQPPPPAETPPAAQPSAPAQPASPAEPAAAPSAPAAASSAQAAAPASPAQPGAPTEPPAG